MGSRMIRFIGITVLVLSAFDGLCQMSMPSIREMKWGRDYNLHIKLSNDSNYVMDVRGLYHTGDQVFDPENENATYYPVSFDEEFINYIKHRKLEFDRQLAVDSASKEQPKTLWSALHRTLGGGYIHFINCLVYSIESNQLYLADPIMKRPVTDWKPKPMTQTYRRTKDWEYYIPYDQKLATKEYKRRLKENDLKDLQGVPDKFIDLFLNTSQKQYDQLRMEGKRVPLAQIDLVRLLLGAKYLGVDQINFIQNRVTSAVMLYSINNLPSVIIFDDYNAAVAMTLDKTGYKIDYVVFNDFDRISVEEQDNRIQMIEAMIDAINEANDKVFKKKLSTYYGS
jgi:hypothetical protein